MDSVSVTRLELRQYKSVERCDLSLSPITMLVGRNGVGKSNILDALRFVADSLRNPLEFAIHARGGIGYVRRKSLGGRPTNPLIRVHLRLPRMQTAAYAFGIAAEKNGGFRVDREECLITDPSGKPLHSFVRDGGSIQWSAQSLPPTSSPDRLFLVAASGAPEFRPVFDVLTRMTFHNLNPQEMKKSQRPAPGELLNHDGSNLASVIKQLNPEAIKRVVEYLRAIGTPVSNISHKLAGSSETIEVSQEVMVPEGVRNSKFEAISLSDGTLRAIGTLVSLVSAKGRDAGGPSLIGIEEPETALHPAAAGALMDALIEGSARTQLILTCHSPDFLDHEGVTPEMIRPVLLENGKTVAGPLSNAKCELLKEHLSTAGELLRLDQLQPDPADLKRQREEEWSLFGAAS